MIRYVPDFILQRYAEGVMSGSFAGFVLLADIVDFTRIGTDLQKHGKQGAEELSELLRSALSGPIEIIREKGGFVSLFSGDAVCAIFPDADPTNVVAAVDSISELFKAKPALPTSAGPISLKVRQTVAYGDIRWKIFVNEVQNEYVFSGPVFAELAELAGLKAELAFSVAARRQLELNKSDSAQAYIKSSSLPHPSVPERSTIATAPKVSTKFLNPKYSALEPPPEIRSAAFCFASLEGVPPEQRSAAIACIERLADVYNGFVNKLDATDKGLIAIVMFGLPKTSGKTLEQISGFALELISELPSLALGLSCGSVFAGRIGSDEDGEYTALGYPVNLASRLMARARPGEILTDANFWQEHYRIYPFTFLGVLNLKGIGQPLRYYRLEQKSGAAPVWQESRFAGREAELRQLRELIDTKLKERKNALISVCGEPGIGKSRLVAGALAFFSDSDFYLVKITCDALQRPPLEAFKQLVRAQFYYNPSLPAAAGIAMFRGLWSDLADGDPELIRIESIIASLLAYGWENSVWSVLPAAEKPGQLQSALATFLAKLARDRPVILFVDDAQWLDEESLGILRHLSEKGIGPLLIVAACRYGQDGSIPDLALSGHQKLELELGNLGEAASAELIASILRLARVPEATAELITARAMGNPLFVEQLTTYLQATGSLNDKGEVTAELGYLSSFGISDIVGARIDRLADDVRESVTSASVLGAEFNIDVLARMLNRQELPELEDGVRNRIWKAIDELRYIFTHILIRDTIYQRTVSAKLRQLHQLAAEALATLHKEDPSLIAEEIARHYELAGLSVKAADYLVLAAQCYYEGSLLKKAEECAAQALQIRQKEFGAEDPRAVASLSQMAKIQHAQGKYPEAEELYKKIVEIREKILGLDHLDTLDALANLAALNFDLARYDTLEPVFQRIIDKRAEILGKENPATALAMVNLANLYTQQGKLDQAGPLAQAALEILVKTRGEEHPDTLAALNNLANLHIYKGEWEPAEKLLNRALPLWEKLRGKDHPDLAMSLNNLANVYLNQGKHTQAEPLYQRVVDIYEKVLGARHPNTAISWFNLAATYAAVDRYAEAEPLFLKAFEVWRESLGAAHPYTVMAIQTLSDLYRETEDLEKSERYQAMLPAAEASAPG